MNKLRIAVATFLMIFSIGTVSLTVLTPTTSAASSSCSTRPFLTFPAWYRGLTDAKCNIMDPGAVGGLSAFIWRIVLNALEIGLQAVAYISTIFIIVGGFRFLTSAADPGNLEKGKKTLTNAIIGLVISIASIAVVNLLFGVITGFKP